MPTDAGKKLKKSLLLTIAHRNIYPIFKNFLQHYSHIQIQSHCLANLVRAALRSHRLETVRVPLSDRTALYRVYAPPIDLATLPTVEVPASHRTALPNFPNIYHMPQQTLLVPILESLPPCSTFFYCSMYCNAL